MTESTYAHVRDLASLSDLSEEGMLNALQQRYNHNLIYTYLGDILVAVNPFTSLNIYDVKDQLFYGSDSTEVELGVPHTFAVGTKAYRALMNYGQSQCVIVNGESGAGKTESSKQIAKQIIYLCAAGQEGNVLENRILLVNPVLEAFGNAQTLLNNNSSRFGKYMELLFDMEGKLQGATITDYLLEKSRVSHQISNEQNFHVLYYVFDMPGAKELGLEDHSNFVYLQKRKMEMDEEDFEENCEGVVEAFKFIGFTEEQIDAIKSVLAAVLHIGNITFNDYGDTVEVTQQGLTVVDRIASILQIEAPEIVSALTVHMVRTKTESVPRAYKLHEAKDTRDSMAKMLYSRLFGWLIYNINNLLCTDEIRNAFNAPKTSNKLYQGIGILDIFGFEQFNTNGFEQWCINLANEQLQHIFNRHVFQLEHEEYKAEGIDASDIVFTDNDKLISMFLDVGLFALLDEETTRPQGNSSALVRKFTSKFNGNKYFRPSRGDSPIFTINHFAAEVEYSAIEFIKKNRDNLATGILEALESSTLELVSDLVHGEIGENGFMPNSGIKSRNLSLTNSAGYKQKRRKATVASYFKKSLSLLVSKLSLCTPHFVRCIKPNMTKQPYSFSRNLVLNQLRYTGMMATVKIRREGYSWRLPFKDFIFKFKILAFNWNSTPEPTRGNVERILAKANINEGFKIGRTKVFLKYFHEDTLFAAMHSYDLAAKVLQKTIRGHLSRLQLRQRRDESNTQVEQVSKFLELIGLLGTRGHDMMARARTTDTVRRKEEEEQRVREEVRKEAEVELLQQIEKLEEERQAKALETEVMLQHAREANEKRMEAEEELQNQIRMAEEERIQRQQALIEAEKRLQEEAERAEQEKLEILEEQDRLERELEEARKEQEEQRRAVLEAQLKVQQTQREAEEKAIAATRDKEEAVLLEQKEWQTLVSQITSARDQAEEELSGLKGTTDVLQLQVAELDRQLQEARDELANEVVIREELETSVADSNENFARELLMRANIERAHRATKEQNQSLKRSLIASEETIQSLRSRMKEEVDRRRTLSHQYQSLEIEKTRLEANADIMGSKAFKERQEDLKLKIERSRALRSLARNIASKSVNLRLANLRLHIQSLFDSFPDEKLVKVEQFKISGYLSKQGEVNSGFKDRFIVLDFPKHVLHYRNDHKTDKIKGVIEVSQMIFVSHAADLNNGFIIGTPKRNYVMAAPTPLVRDMWIEALRLCLGDVGRKMTSTEHALQAESLRIDYELRLSTMKAHIKKLELQLENEKIKRVDADLRAHKAGKQRDTALETKAQVEEVAARKLMQQKQATLRAMKTQSDPELDAMKSGIQTVVRARGTVTDAILAHANLRRLLENSLISGNIPAHLVVTPATMEGSMTKIGNWNKSWKQRWFLLDLRRCTLEYLQNQNSAKVNGTISLVEVVDVVVPSTAEARADNTILVVTLSRTYQFRAPNQEQLQSWFIVLSAIAEGNKEDQESGK
eukprot:m.34620 g.34620  ORF g.34620 m.34620 type:complete len:1480 (+) comp6544_c0_seq1:29-4468(+)